MIHEGSVAIGPATVAAAVGGPHSANRESATPRPANPQPKRQPGGGSMPRTGT